MTLTKNKKKPMSNIIGPIDRATWKTLIMLKGSLKHYSKSKTGIDYQIAIERET